MNGAQETAGQCDMSRRAFREYSTSEADIGTPGR